MPLVARRALSCTPVFRTIVIVIIVTAFKTVEHQYRGTYRLFDIDPLLDPQELGISLQTPSVLCSDPV